MGADQNSVPDPIPPLVAVEDLRGEYASSICGFASPNADSSGIA